MSLASASVELDEERSDARLDSVWSVIFHIWEDEPVFHGVRYRRTLCGREIGLYTPSLPMKHARQFGRPCRSCWPLR